MKKALYNGLAVALVLCSGWAQAANFEEVKTKNLDGDKFMFPADLDAPKVNIVLLAIGTEQDNGTWQGDVLVEWYGRLQSEGVLSDDVKAWHFSVMKVPFFIKGVIRGGLAESYEGKLPMNQAAPLYVGDAEEFATAAGIVMDENPKIVLMTPDGVIHESFKGEPTDDLLAQIKAAVAQYSAAAP